MLGSRTSRSLLSLAVVLSCSQRIGADHDGKAYQTATAVAAVGLASTIVYDWISAPKSAQRYNEQRQPFGPWPGKPFKPKSGKRALMLSVGATLIPVGLGTIAAIGNRESLAAGLISSGLLIGPSVGHFYVGRAGRGLTTIGIRFALGTVGAVSSRQWCCD